jgi:pimeloyl-ACP methyl ester carboxylesterase
MHSTRVLFIHGLESHPNGSKVRILRTQGFDVVAPDLDMGVMQLARRNSVARQLLRSFELRTVAGVTAATLSVSILTSSWLGVGAVVIGATTWVISRRRALFAEAVSRSFDASVQIARAASEREHVDVLVGSSWGGAVAAELVRKGAWSGPTILLAPAIAKVHGWTRRTDAAEELATLRKLSAVVPIVLFHDPSDDTVPFVDSANLARGTQIDLRSVDAGGHRLLPLLERGELSAAIRQVVDHARDKKSTAASNLRLAGQ